MREDVDSIFNFDPDSILNLIITALWKEMCSLATNFKNIYIYMVVNHYSGGGLTIYNY